MQALLAPMQPMMHSGDADGEDCLFARLYVDNLTMSDAKIQLTPVDGGLQFYAELDGLDVPGHMRYAAACVSGSNTVDVSATKVSIAGTLLVTPNGMGFDTQLVNQDVQLSGLHISASGIPGAVLDILPMDSIIRYVAPKAAEMFMGPMMNKALGALGGPKQLNVLGKTIDIEVVPSDISSRRRAGSSCWTPRCSSRAPRTAGLHLHGQRHAEHGPGPGHADRPRRRPRERAAGQVEATGMLDLDMPAQGGTFDTRASR